MKELFQYIQDNQPDIHININIKLIVGLYISKDELFVGHTLDLSDTEITSLPDNLAVRLSLYLDNTNISSLPDNLFVGNTLCLRKTKITSLPKGLNVGGNLDIRQTDIMDLPDDLHCECVILVNTSKRNYFKAKYPQYKIL